MTNLDIPINSVSFGQVSWNILKELKSRNADINLFPYSERIDLSAFDEKPEEGFSEWLLSKVKEGSLNGSRENRTFKLWHIRGSLPSLSREGNDLLTFHETDTLTDVEYNILSQQRKVFVTSKYTQDVFKSYGIDSTYVPLGFDSYHFKKVDVPRPKGDLELTFGLFGKLEKRKNSIRTVQLWAKKFGNNPKYRLNCAIFNPFLDLQEQQGLILSAMGGSIPWNINFLPITPRNSDFNICLNSIDTVISLSGCEGFNLPLFQCIALGKQAVVLNAHAHKDFCNKENSILVEPNENRVEAHDGKFFIKGQDYNQGSWFDFDDDAVMAAFDKAVERGREVNTEGEKLASWSYKNLVDTILE